MLAAAERALALCWKHSLSLLLLLPANPMVNITKQSRAQQEPHIKQLYASEAEHFLYETAPGNGYLATVNCNPAWELPRIVVHCMEPQRDRGARASHEYEEVEDTSSSV